LTFKHTIEGLNDVAFYFGGEITKTFRFLFTAYLAIKEKVLHILKCSSNENKIFVSNQSAENEIIVRSTL